MSHPAEVTCRQARNSLMVTRTIPFIPPTFTDQHLNTAASLLNLDPAFLFRDARRQAATRMDSFDVTACPGSGKTTLLVAKLAMLASTWSHSTRGLCILSHTNVARNEIEVCLGNSIYGRSLFSFPHYIGTIHGFVNEFLALPWLRARGYPVRVIDNEIVLRRRWNALSVGTRLGLERNNHTPQVLVIQSPDFSVGSLKWGKGKLGNKTSTFKEMQKICRISTSRGFLCHDEMFVWANELLNQAEGVAYSLRYRFPIVFIDEAQDNSEDQSAILQRVFLDGDEPAICQRFGDENQAIFDSVQTQGAKTNPFPNRQTALELANSHRFGQSIADLAAPFAAEPLISGLKGDGPRRALESGRSCGSHTIFLIDENSATKVLPAYGDLLIRTFSLDELRQGTFLAVGQIHRPPTEDHLHKHPHHLGHYWPAYKPAFSKSEPTPTVFSQYVSLGVSKASLQGESTIAVEKIAEAILRLSGEGKNDLSPRKYRHRQILEMLKDSDRIRGRYEHLIDTLAVQRQSLTEESWIGKWRPIVLEIAEAISRMPLSGAAVESFLRWEDYSPATSQIESNVSVNTANLYRHPEQNPLVNIQLASIHSVKGQTHTATLVLETFWKAHNLQKIAPWILGEKIGCTIGESEDQIKRMKLHYVAMTRPMHLLCLAIKRRMLEDGRGNLDLTKIQVLKRRGWEIHDVTRQLPLLK